MPSIWDAATAREIAALRGRDNSVNSAVFLTCSYDNCARIWDTATATEIAVLRGHDVRLWSANFSPEGNRIVTASQNNAARIRDVRFAVMSTRDLITEVCLRPLRGLTILTRDEMQLAGYADDVPAIAVGAEIAEGASP
jgi:WD40 repeat protein